MNGAQTNSETTATTHERDKSERDESVRDPLMTFETQPRADNAQESRAEDARESHAFARLRLQESLEPRADGRYHIGELLDFHDLAFVESAYAATLARTPTTDELSATLADLRAARRDKKEIVEALIESEEGARVGARERIVGIGASGWKQRVRRLPVVGYLWQLFTSVVRLPVSLRHQREFETYALAQQQLIADHFNAQAEHFNAQARAQEANVEELRRRIDSTSEELRGRIESASEELRRHVTSADEELRRINAASVESRSLIDESRNFIDESRRLVNDASSAASLLSDALAALAARQAGFDQRLDALHEYLAQEQRSIVEAEKAALVEIEGRLADALASQRDALAALSARVAAMAPRADDTRAPVEAAREGGDAETT
jgi:hypothetical protein